MTLKEENKIHKVKLLLHDGLADGALKIGLRC